MSSKLTRRAAMVGVAAIPALAATGAADYSVHAAPDDPIFSLIEAHKAAYSALEAISSIYGEMHEPAAPEILLYEYPDVKMEGGKDAEGNLLISRWIKTGKMSAVKGRTEADIRRNALAKWSDAEQEEWITQKIAELHAAQEAAKPDRVAYDRAQAANYEASDFEVAAAWALVEAQPTTIAGLTALFSYVAEHATGGAEWPGYSDTYDKQWSIELVTRAAGVLASIAAENRSEVR